MFLASDAIFEEQRGHYGNALQAASSKGHDKIVEMFPKGQYTHGRRLGDYSNLFTVRTSAWHVTAKVRYSSLGILQPC